jgi:hypothetical protein
MTGLYIIYTGMLLVAAVILGYDLLTRRQKRRDRQRGASA